MSKFKVGDRVSLSRLSMFYSQCDGTDGKIVELDCDSTGWFRVQWDCGTKNWYPEGSLELTSTNKITMTSIKEKFVTALLPEPEKSFRKAEITNGDGLLTSDGQTIFLTWLLNQNKSTFNKEVVQPILAEEDIVIS